MLGKGLHQQSTHFWFKIRDLFAAKPDNSVSGKSKYFKTNGISFANVLVVGRIVEVLGPGLLILQDGPTIQITVDTAECVMSHTLEVGDWVRVLGRFLGEMSILANHSITKLSNRELSLMHIELKEKAMYYNSKNGVLGRSSLNNSFSLSEHLSTPVGRPTYIASSNQTILGQANDHAEIDYSDLTEGIFDDNFDDIEPF